MDYTSLVGNTAVVCTVISNFAGLTVCWDILNRKSTSGVSALPFLSAALCTTLWLQYGIFVEDTAVKLVNAMASCMQVFYLACYYYATHDKGNFTIKLLSSATALLSVSIYSFHVATKQEAIQILGILSCCGSIAASAAPLAQVKEVFKTRSTKNLPFIIILATFIVTTLWYIYGVLVNDSFIKVPNFISAVLSSLQLSLFFIFNSKDTQLKSD